MYSTFFWSNEFEGTAHEGNGNKLADHEGVLE